MFVKKASVCQTCKQKTLFPCQNAFERDSQLTRDYSCSNNAQDLFGYRKNIIFAQSETNLKEIRNTSEPHVAAGVNLRPRGQRHAYKQHKFLYRIPYAPLHWDLLALAEIIFPFANPFPVFTEVALPYPILPTARNQIDFTNEAKGFFFEEEAARSSFIVLSTRTVPKKAHFTDFVIPARKR